MLAQSEMIVVFVLAEKITLGIRERITAERCLRLAMTISIKCHSDE